MSSPPPPATASGSILESIGSEIVGVMAPVSICMATVVLIVYTLFASTSPMSFTTAANLVYAEDSSDTLAQKLQGSVLNALVFVSLIALVTFLLFVLYYFNFTNFLTNYTRFSSFLILSSLGGSIFFSLLRRLSIPLDSITAAFLVLNFSAVGTMSLFSPGFPVVLRQCYTIALGVITAVWFVKLPEWTTWMVLVALAVYDLVAVLAPGGPLKLLVELASRRGEDLPALVYESRPNVSAPRSPAIELQAVAIMESSSIEVTEEEEEMSPLVVEEVLSGNGNERRVLEAVEREKGIRLGLGDFIFYSVLVGRAAMFDLMTVYACYLAIISGLGCTLVLLSVYRRALPALPISIALGVVFYFLTRLLVEPFVVGAATNLLMF